MSSAVLAVALGLLPGCDGAGERADPPGPGTAGGPSRVAVPPADAPAPPGVRRPAGEVPPNSRRPPGDEEGAEAPAGFDYAVPGIPASGTHYHVRVPDAGPATAGLAGGTSPRPVCLSVFRVKRCVDAALEVKKALLGLGSAPGILDPSTAGGCGDAAEHRPPGGRLRSPPPVRVVRLSLDSGSMAKADRAVAEVPGLRKVLDTCLGGPAPGEVWLDVHLVEE